MKPRKRSLVELLNPFSWLAAIFEPLLRWLGLLPPPSTSDFENIQPADVDEAAAAAERSEEALDAIVADTSPAEVVKAYAAASPSARSEMDLSSLEYDVQDWLLGLSDDELTRLAMSTTAGCARSLRAKAVRPIYQSPPADVEEAHILQFPTAADLEKEKRKTIAKRFQQVRRELWLAQGASDRDPHHVPRPTLH